MLDLHVPKIKAYLVERVVEGVIMEIFSCLLDTFPVLGSYFLLI